MSAIELRVVVETSDPSPLAADRIESLVRRNLHRELDPGLCTVERVTPPGLTRYTRHPPRGLG